MGNDMFNDEQLAHAKVQAIQYDPACVDCRQDAAKSQAGTTWQCARHVRAEWNNLLDQRPAPPADAAREAVREEPFCECGKSRAEHNR